MQGTKRAHADDADAAACEPKRACTAEGACADAGKQGAKEKGGEEENSLFSLVTVAEQQRQAQERGEPFPAPSPASTPSAPPSSSPAPSSSQLFSLTSSSPALGARQAIFPPAERLIAFTTASREYPHLRPVPLRELATLKSFRAWVRREFELRDDAFVLVDRSVEANNDGEEGGAIDSDSKLSHAKDIEIVEVPQVDEAERMPVQDAETQHSNALVQNHHQDLFIYAKSILVFLAEKGNPEARSIVASCPSAFAPPLASVPAHAGADGALAPVLAVQAPPAPALPRILAQAPPCLIPGYYIFSPVFDSFGEKRKLPIKIEIPRTLVFDGERYKTVSTYIGLGPFGNDPNAFVRLEGDHLVGTIASRVEDDEEGGNGTGFCSPTCTYVFKNLRLKTRSLIRTVLDVAYSGMRTGRFFFMVDNEVLPTTSRRFEIKAPSGYTIKMVNKTARSNPVAKHAHRPASPPHSHSSPPSPRPLSPTATSPLPVSPRSTARPLSQSQPLPQMHTPLVQPPPSPLLHPPSTHFQLQAPPTHTRQQLQSQLAQLDLAYTQHPNKAQSPKSPHQPKSPKSPSQPQVPLPLHSQLHTQTQTHSHMQAAAPAHASPHAHSPAHASPHAHSSAHTSPHAHSPAHMSPHAHSPAHAQTPAHAHHTQTHIHTTQVIHTQTQIHHAQTHAHAHAHVPALPSHLPHAPPSLPSPLMLHHHASIMASPV